MGPISDSEGGGGGSSAALVYIVGPVLGAFALAAVVALLVLLSVGKKKRSLYGTYSPQKQEFSAPRLELAEMKLRLPNEERLI